MKRSIMNIFLAILISSMSLVSYGQQLNKEQISSIASFTKVWGYLKYYHPEISKGQIDWDSVFVTILPEILDSDVEDFNAILKNLIDGLGEINTCNSCEDIRSYPHEWTRNLNFDWFDKDSALSEYNTSLLHSICKNRHQGEGYYCAYAWGEQANRDPVKFTNEKDYNDSLLIHDYRYRLLALARYWNAVEYFFAYKYLLSQNWDLELQKYIPILYRDTKLKDYHMNITRLTREVEDSHSGSGHSWYLLTNLWNKKPPFDIITIDGKTLIRDIRFEELNKVNNIKIGDEILEIDGVPVGEARTALYDLCKSSNDKITSRTIDSQLLVGNTDTFNLNILRNGKLLDVEITRYPFNAFWNYPQKEEPPIVIQENYSIIDLGLLSSKEQIDSVMKVAKKKDAIIFDLRTNPMFDWNDLKAHFVNASVSVFRAYEPSLSDIGIFKPAIKEEIELEKRKLYSGKLIIIVNEFTQSYGESVAMFFQTLPNSIVIGSQTSGANGYNTQIILPGNINARFSNIIIEYPDGRQCQKKGIQIDHQVELTVGDILSKRDPYIEFAEELVK